MEWTPFRKKACLYFCTFVIVWNTLFFPIGPVDNNGDKRDISASTDTSVVPPDDTWTSGPLDFTSTSQHRNNYKIIRGAAMMLVSKPWRNRRGERQCYFNKSLDALGSHWYPTNPYPIILQHPDGWSDTEMDDIRQRWPHLSLYFSKLGKAFHVDPPKHMEDEEKPISPLGYKKMAFFKTFGFLQAPYIKSRELDYMFYIDDDSCLTEPIRFDVFQKMQQHNVAYVYKQLFLDRDYVVKGLTEFVANYVNKHQLSYANPSLAKWLHDNGFLSGNNNNNSNNNSGNTGSGSHWTFSTNLEWIDVRQYRRPNIMEFHNAIATSGMIFHRRWGDAPLRFLLAYLFWDNTQVMKICFAYVHSMWKPSQSTCSDPMTQTPAIRDAVLHQLQGCIGKSTCD